MILNTIRNLAIVSTIVLVGASHADAAKAPPKAKVTSFGNWSVLCPPDGDTSGIPCAMQLSLVDKKRKVAIIVWRVGFNQKNELLFDLMTPTEVMIKNGVRLAIGNAKAITIPYVSCGLRGCESRTKVSGAVIAAMKTAKQATMAIAATNGKPIQLKLDIAGLGQAMAAIGVP